MKRQRGPVTTPLEMRVPVNFKVVGRREWLQSAWEPGALDSVEVVEISCPGDMAPIKRHLDRMPVHGADCETTGKNVKGDKSHAMNPVNRDNRIALFQIGNEDMVYVTDPDLLPEYKDHLESDKHLHLFHNAIYDFKWLLVKKGIHVQRIYCSMLAEQLLVAGLLARRVGLADAVRRRSPYWLISKARRDDFITLDDRRGKLTWDMGYYGARDIPLMFPLMREQTSCLREERLLVIAQDEFDALYPTAEMEIEGVPLALPVMRQIIEYWNDHEEWLAGEIFKLHAQLRRDAGNDEATSLFPGLEYTFSLTSNAAKLEALREIDIDLDNIRRDALKGVSKGFVEKKHGTRTVKVEVDFTPGQRQLALMLAEFSNVTKFKTTYGQNLVDKINPYTNRWHPRFKQLGSGEEEARKAGADEKSTIATGRFSSDAQQFPKPKEIFAPVRRAEEVRQVMAVFGDRITALRAEARQQQVA